MAAMFGSSLCLGISDIPFDGPVAGVMVGMDEKGKFIINPTTAEAEKSKLALTVAGTHDAICMVEAGCKELPEKTMLEALMFAHENIKTLCEFQNEIISEIGKEKVVLEKANKYTRFNIKNLKNMLKSMKLKQILLLISKKFMLKMKILLVR